MYYVQTCLKWILSKCVGRKIFHSLKDIKGESYEVQTNKEILAYAKQEAFSLER